MLAEFPDPAMRQAVLTAALSLAPQQPGDLEVALITSVHETTHPRALTLAGAPPWRVFCKRSLNSDNPNAKQNPKQNQPWPNGSFVTIEEYPKDIDIAINLVNLTSSRQQAINQALRPIMLDLQIQYKVDLQLNLPSRDQDFIAYFQEVKGDRNARGQIPDNMKKGILRLQ